jgi:hypothetical protein
LIIVYFLFVRPVSGTIQTVGLFSLISLSF